MKKSRVGEYNPTHFRRFATAALLTDIDLTAQSGCPKYEAERLEVTNNTAGALDFVCRGADLVDVPFSIPANSVRVIRAAVMAIEATGTGALTEVHAFWWREGNAPLNP